MTVIHKINPINSNPYIELDFTENVYLHEIKQLISVEIDGLNQNNEEFSFEIFSNDPLNASTNKILINIYLK